MGWASAGDIIDPQIPIMVEAVDNGELDEAKAVEVLSNLIDKLQDNDWDTEDESLEQWLHVPWVVKAFAQHGVFPVAPNETVERSQVYNAVSATLDAIISPDLYDLSESADRHRVAEKVTNAIASLFSLDAE